MNAPSTSQVVWHESMMQAALFEGRKARHKCAPNPPVGCVVTLDGRIVASGHTQEPGGPHAEALALESLPSCLSNYEVFVTLEPCAFHGRTPSCAQALAQRAIGHVVVGMLDPDPRNSGNGLDILRNAGVRVTVGVLEDDVKADLEPLLFG